MCKFLIFVLISLSVSCGKNNQHSGSRLPPLESQKHNEESPGRYHSVLKVINSDFKDNQAYGTAIINIENNKMEVNLNLVHIPSATKHIQSIHASGKCPELTHDKNQDNFVDVVEGLDIFGKILIPLDGDINGQISGENYFPTTNKSGSYSYTEDADLDQLMSDLKTLDENPSDHVVKLSAYENINLTERTLVISVIGDSRELPTTVASIEDLSSEAYIPVACGTIVQIKDEE